MERSYYPIEKPLVEQTRVLEMFAHSSDIIKTVFTFQTLGESDKGIERSKDRIIIIIRRACCWCFSVQCVILILD